MFLALLSVSLSNLPAYSEADLLHESGRAELADDASLSLIMRRGGGGGEFALQFRFACPLALPRRRATRPLSFMAKAHHLAAAPVQQRSSSLIVISLFLLGLRTNSLQKWPIDQTHGQLVFGPSKRISMRAMCASAASK